MSFRIDANLKSHLHRQVESGIRAMLRGGQYQPGDWLFTEVGLGQKHGISLGPIRQAVNVLVAEGVLERRRSKGVFYIARGKTSALARRITLVLPDIGHSFYGSMARGGEHEARERGFDIAIANSDFSREREAAILAQLAGGAPHVVVICTNGGAQCREAVTHLVAQGFVVVMIDRHFPGVDVDGVENDNIQIGRDATAYLLGLGHRRIVHATETASMALNTGDRQEGYEQAMRAAGLKAETLVVQGMDESWETDCERRMLAWLEQHRQVLPTAVFAVNDTVCVGIIRAVKRFGLAVPGDISIVGCADLDLARALSEPLTTIDQDSYGMGRRGVDLGVARWLGGNTATPVREIYPHRLVERMTSRRLEPVVPLSGIMARHTRSANTGGKRVRMKHGKEVVEA
jgi:LacI family transcriptional regulator